MEEEPSSKPDRTSSNRNIVNNSGMFLYKLCRPETWWSHTHREHAQGA